jgi:hypothetical protein
MRLKRGKPRYTLLTLNLKFSSGLRFQPPQSKTVSHGTGLTFVVFSVVELNKTNWVPLCVRNLFPSFQFSSCLKCSPP